MHVIAAATLVGLLAALMPGLARGEAAPTPDPLQVMADAVLIDAACHNVSVDFGIMIRFGEARGISALAIMPLGELRPKFEAAMASRSKAAGKDVLCTSIAAQENSLLPGIIREP